MKKFYCFIILCSICCSQLVTGQTVVPNGDFESWVNHTTYQDPLYWDTPNPEVATIPFIGVTVVSKSSDHASGSYSARLETKHLSFPSMDIPGFITLGNLTVNVTAGTYNLTGGTPINDNPTHLQGFYKYLPQGGDSCVVAMLLYKSNGGVRDTIGGTAFSSKATVSDWTPFSVWIEYMITGVPDTMNIFAVSTAQETGMHPGTVLFLDNLTLDYSVSVNGVDPRKEINTYLDKETRRILAFFDFDEPRLTSMSLFDILGRKVAESSPAMIQKGREVISFGSAPEGIYLLEIIYSEKKFVKKIYLNF